MSHIGCGPQSHTTVELMVFQNIQNKTNSIIWLWLQVDVYWWKQPKFFFFSLHTHHLQRWSRTRSQSGAQHLDHGHFAMLTTAKLDYVNKIDINAKETATHLSHSSPPHSMCVGISEGLIIQVWDAAAPCRCRCLFFFQTPAGSAGSLSGEYSRL